MLTVKTYRRFMYLGAFSYAGSMLITVSAIRMGLAVEANPITRVVLSHPALTVFWSFLIFLGIVYPAYRMKSVKNQKVAFGVVVVCILLFLNFLREIVLLFRVLSG